MEILVFKTNIHQKNDIENVRNIFSKDKNILAWTIDIEDVDKVLRIEATTVNITGNVEDVLNEAGYFCRELV